MAERTKKKGLSGFLDSTFANFLRREPRQSRSQSVVEAAVQALDEMLERGKSLDDVTVDAVSDRAGVGMGSFYEYFSGKDSLLGVLIGRVTERNFQRLSADLDACEHETLDDLVLAFSVIATQTYLAHPVRMRVLVEGCGRLGLMGIVNRERDRFALLMAQKVQAHLPDEPFDGLSKTLRLVADANMGILIAAALRREDPVPEEFAVDLSNLALDMIRRRHPAR